MVKIKNFFSNIMRSNFWGLLIISILVFAGIAIFVNPVFVSGINIANVLKAAGLYIGIGLAQMVVMSVGQFSLAIGSIGCFSSMVAIYLIEDHAWNVIPAFIIMFAIGAILGAIQGVIITRLKMQPFIVTLSLQYTFQGLALALFNSRILTAVPGFVIKLNSSGPIKIGGGPIPPWIFLASLIMAVIIFFMYRNTKTGRSFLAVGTSSSAAEIAGLKPQNTILKAHILSGVLASFAALLAMSRSATTSPELGVDWVLYSMACPVLGGTALSGGKVNVFGLVGGAILIQTLIFGLTFLQVDVYWTKITLGIILVFAFSLDYIRKAIAEYSAKKLSIQALKNANNSAKEA